MMRVSFHMNGCKWQSISGKPSKSDYGTIIKRKQKSLTMTGSRKPKHLDKTCIHITTPTINLIRTTLNVNPCLCSKAPASAIWTLTQSLFLLHCMKRIKLHWLKKLLQPLKHWCHRQWSGQLSQLSSWASALNSEI